MSEDKILNGSCLCGAVTFQIECDFKAFFLCHCSRCRKDTGSAHAANLFAPAGNVKWLSGEQKIKTFRLAQTRHQKSFCSDCGSVLPTTQMGGDLLVVPAGSLDGALNEQPVAHICYADRADWDNALEKLNKYDGLPE